MKIKFKQTSRLLIKLHLLKYQMYKNYFNTNLNDLTIELKQALKIIYLYNKKKKKIVFIGFPFNKNLHNQLNQSFISKTAYIKKIKNNNLDFSFNSAGSLKTKPELIVFYKTSDKDLLMLKELKKSNIPLILFGNNDKQFVKSYSVSGSLKKNKIKKFCSFLIFSVLIKTNKL